MKERPINGNQFMLPLDEQAALERDIDARVAIRAEEEAWRWRFRLITIETLMMGALVAVAGLIVGKPAMLVLRASVLVSAACFASGMLLLGLSVGTGRLWSGLRVGRKSARP